MFVSRTFLFELVRYRNWCAILFHIFDEIVCVFLDKDPFNQCEVVWYQLRIIDLEVDLLLLAQWEDECAGDVNDYPKYRLDVADDHSKGDGLALQPKVMNQFELVVHWQSAKIDWPISQIKSKLSQIKTNWISFTVYLS